VPPDWITADWEKSWEHFLTPSLYVANFAADRLSDRRLSRFEIPRLDELFFFLRRFFGRSLSESNFMFFLFPLVVTIRS
jgi:hypothetical protein